MLIKKINNLPPKIKIFLKKASLFAVRNKMNIYLVGGIVRDFLLNLKSIDYDIAVYGDGIELAQNLADHFKCKISKHKSFGTATVYYGDYKIDFSTCRKESYAHHGALPKVNPSTLNDDLCRRDFTINAMAISLNKGDYGKLIDTCCGYADLRKGLIRVMHEMSFLDDPTRILRAIKFEKRFSFKIDGRTLNLIKSAAGLKALGFVDEQRLRDELILILKEGKPYKCIKRINSLVGLSFIDSKLSLTKKTTDLFLRIEKAISLHGDNFSKHANINYWLVYLLVFASKLSKTRSFEFCRKFRFKKEEQKILFSVLRQRSQILKLGKKDIKKAQVFKLLKSFRSESILFFYAYFESKIIRKNIILFFDQLLSVRIHLRGQDLKDMGFSPRTFYGRALDRLHLFKIENGAMTKEAEVCEIKKIFPRLKKARNL